MKAFRKVALVICMVMCAGLLFAKGVKVEAGNGDDPFVGTAWVFKGMELLTFKDGGTVEHGNKDFKYTVVQNGEYYTANFKVAGVKGEITIATKDTAETVFKLGPQKMNVSKK